MDSLAAMPLPFPSGAGVVLPEWIDANDHMNLAYYVVLFDQATDVLFDAAGMGPQYKATTGNGTFAVETHTLYETELRRGDDVRMTTSILAVDAKRVHLAHEMHRADGVRAAMQELMYLHVSLHSRRTQPWPAPIREALDRLATDHASKPPPPWTGRRIGMSAGRV